MLIYRASVACGFKELGKDRSLYDMFHKIPFLNSYRNIEIIPGYSAAFDKYVDCYLLRVEVAHKAMDSKSIHQLIEEKHCSSQDEIEADLIGKQILTR